MKRFCFLEPIERECDHGYEILATPCDENGHFIMGIEGNVYKNCTSKEALRLFIGTLVEKYGDELDLTYCYANMDICYKDVVIPYMHK